MQSRKCSNILNVSPATSANETGVTESMKKSSRLSKPSICLDIQSQISECKTRAESHINACMRLSSPDCCFVRKRKTVTASVYVVCTFSKSSFQKESARIQEQKSFKEFPFLSRVHRHSSNTYHTLHATSTMIVAGTVTAQYTQNL